jgi:hypothetical protein
MKKRILVMSLGAIGTAGSALAQIPDLLNTIDAGSRSMGSGGAFGVTSADTSSILNNPAGIGFISTRTFGLSTRNMPRSNTTLTGSLSNPTFSTKGASGKNQLGHFGYAMPMKNGGTFGFSFQVGGYLDDFRSGTNITIGSFNNATYQEEIRAKTDFYTMAIGKANTDGTRSIGYGLTIANLNLSDKQNAFVPGNPPTQLISSDEAASTWGIGLVAGFQTIPSSRPNTTFGGSIRTPIKLNNNTFSSPLYSTIPGQVTLGMATRKDNFRGKEDFMVTGIQGSYYFGGSGSGIFDRSNQLVLGIGAEYNMVSENYTLPIRIGFSRIASGGSQFADRNALTFGFGIHPTSTPWSLDVNYGFPRNGGRDFALLLNYKFQK